jgi:trehalose/maltose hydrolase-like predicted phosphorylase
MSKPMSPPPARGGREEDLPAYLSNGLVGLRIEDMPLMGGMALVCGYAGAHPERRIEAAAAAPYPLAADLRIGGLWLSDAREQVKLIDQTYDFACGEVTSRFEFQVGEATARAEVLTFCSRGAPSVVCQEVAVEVSAACEMGFRALLDGRGIEGRAIGWRRETPGEPGPACDGAWWWEAAGGGATCGLAYVSELQGATADPVRPPPSGGVMKSEYGFRARAGRRYRLRQITSLVPSVVHARPDQQAVRLVALAKAVGFDTLRAENRAIWDELWKGRITLVGAEPRWQGLADAAMFYLLSSTHAGSPASTSIFGLATWRDYHYYYGHVMWDIEAFCVPPLALLQPDAARSLLDYRSRSLEAARRNAKLRGRIGAQFPWESGPSTGEEASPMPGTAAWREDHVSLGVAHAMGYFADVSGDANFARRTAWPVQAEVARWTVGRAIASDRGYEIRQAMGIAEREVAADNAAYTNMAAAVTLDAAARAAEQLGETPDPKWREVARGLTVARRGQAVVAHDGYRINEEKGATPDPLMGLFPLGYEMTPKAEAATLEFHLAMADDYLGSPMLSALYPVWAAYAGDRALSARMLDEGYGKFIAGRFLQTLEYRTDVFPEQPRAGPFFANLAGFLSGLLTGLPGLRIDGGDPAGWAKRPVVLPKGWEAIEVKRLWVRGRPARLLARQGAKRAELTFED